MAHDDDRRARLLNAGRWLRNMRERHGYAKAVDFARALGVDASLISQYERGVNAVPDERAEQIAEVLGLDIIETRRNLGLWVPAVGEEPGEGEVASGPSLPFDPEADLPENPRERAQELLRRSMAIGKMLTDLLNQQHEELGIPPVTDKPGRERGERDTG